MQQVNVERADRPVHDERQLLLPMRELDRLFAEYHRNNPQVYAELCRLARRARSRGHRKLGIKMLWEVMRWNLSIETDDPTSDFKLNNNYTSRFARLIMRQEADLADAFAVRQLR